MRLDYCAVHSGALIAPGGEPNCLFIRHDDGRIMSQREIWAEIERLRDIAGEAYPGIAHDMEKLRAERDAMRAERETMRQRCRTYRRALRHLNKAHATLWRVLQIRADRDAALAAKEMT